MIRASMNKLFRGISNSPNVLCKRRTTRSPTTTTLATILFLGTTTVVGSSFFFSSASSNNNQSAKKNILLTQDDSQYHHLGNHFLMATSSSSSSTESKVSDIESPQRTHGTAADEYFRRWQKIPLPLVVHDNLEMMMSSEEKKSQCVMASLENVEQKRSNNNRVFVIGDVHGCLEELTGLVSKAIREHNEGKQFAAVVLVGDLCNKGPSSAQVIQHVRNQPGWFSVRGNHDDRALAAALGDEECCSKPKYQWVNSLSDDDVTWMSNLPYTITIPKTMLNNNRSSVSEKNDQDVVIVHAGLIPAIALEKQEVKTMITVRNLTVDDNGTVPKAWATLWRGPELVIFGHDARRGLQQEDYAIGLDSGCVYGKKLTGVILPEREFVSVDAVREHCPVNKNKPKIILKGRDAQSDDQIL
mmetsp:Transcript_36845/g.79553  ORF Transcript_36845/g.79553 Transcript_36845/m.79553 type:complete len:414 (+) Transcript_36845:94-1335(+)